MYGTAAKYWGYLSKLDDHSLFDPAALGIKHGLANSADVDLH